MIRVRFAPSPTGPLHIGGVRTALYNWLFAKKSGGIFILRIEDTDQGRFVEGAEEYIINSLKWLGLEPDEGVGYGGDFAPYRQSERKPIYKEYVEKLLASGNAYYAFDTEEELKTLRAEHESQGKTFKYDATTRGGLNNSLSKSEVEVKDYLSSGKPWVIRLKTNPDETIVFSDVVRGEVSYQSNDLDDKVMLKSDGMPTYHLANVVDDRLMKITHVIRGEEWLPSTPTHVQLYRAFGWEAEMPKFVHLPLLLKPSGKGKLSKRDGIEGGFPVFPTDWTVPSGDKVTGFQGYGFLPDATLNFLAMLGWNPGTEQEIFTKEELIQAFSLEKIGNTGAKFDMDKARWFNQQYILKMPDGEFFEHASKALEQKGYSVPTEKKDLFVLMFKERIVSLSDFWSASHYLFESEVNYSEDDLEKKVLKKWSEEKGAKIGKLLDDLNLLSDFNSSGLHDFIKQFSDENSIGLGDILPFLRIALSGVLQGPNVFDIMSYLGKDTTISRMGKLLSICNEKKS